MISDNKIKLFKTVQKAGRTTIAFASCVCSACDAYCSMGSRGKASSQSGVMNSGPSV